MLHISPDDMARGYELIRHSKPYNAWKLPHADEVEFHASPMKGRDQAEYFWNGTRHVIRLNTRKHHTFESMLLTLRHEMLHVREKMAGLRFDIKHGRDFKRWANQVCRIHVLDRGQF